MEETVLFKGGRITLLKCTLLSLPTHFMSLFTILSHVAIKLERMQTFLWGGLDNVKKIPLVQWDTVCSSIKEEGMGIRKFSTFNRVLLGK